MKKKKIFRSIFNIFADRLVIRSIFVHVSATFKENFQPNTVYKNACLYELLKFEKIVDFSIKSIFAKYFNISRRTTHFFEETQMFKKIAIFKVFCNN